MMDWFLFGLCLIQFGLHGFQRRTIQSMRANLHALNTGHLNSTQHSLLPAIIMKGEAND